MTEILHDLSVIGDVVTDKDRVVHLLASLPGFVKYVRHSIRI